MSNLSRRFYDSPSFTNFTIRIGAVIAVSVLVMVAFLIFLAISLIQPAVVFTQPEYSAAKGILCPGDPLQYTAQVLVYKSPVAPTIVETWWDADKNSQIPSTTNDAVIQIWIGSPTFSVDVPISQTVPNLPPGNYEHRVAMRLNFLYAEAYKVHFTIPNSCP